MTLLKKSNLKKIIDSLIVFSKAQLSAFLGGVTDYFIMIFFTEVFHVHYTISIAIGGIIGAIINFSLNKTWTFRSKNKAYKNSWSQQLMRFILVVINSITLKSLGTYIITSYLKLDYKISRIIIDLFVSIAFNYTLQRFWVFKKTKIV
jgi:putative flippase GtrA